VHYESLPKKQIFDWAFRIGFNGLKTQTAAVMVSGSIVRSQQYHKDRKSDQWSNGSAKGDFIFEVTFWTEARALHSTITTRLWAIFQRFFRNFEGFNFFM